MSDLPYDYIADDAALAALCKRLEHAPYLVLDTEFLRERTYRAELCLIQIKYQDTLAIVDAQTITDLSPLVERLLDTSTVKVLHAASQDLEIFWMMARRVPTPVFDTQLAAPLLGHAEQIGYANLCKAVLDLEIDKSQTRADWTRRPLPEKQIEYALDDVIHLEGDGRDALPGWRDALIGEALSKLAAGEASLRATRAGLALSDS